MDGLGRFREKLQNLNLPLKLLWVIPTFQPYQSHFHNSWCPSCPHSNLGRVLPSVVPLCHFKWPAVCITADTQSWVKSLSENTLLWHADNRDNESIEFHLHNEQYKGKVLFFSKDRISLLGGYKNWAKESSPKRRHPLHSVQPYTLSAFVEQRTGRDLVLHFQVQMLVILTNVTYTC